MEEPVPKGRLAARRAGPRRERRPPTRPGKVHKHAAARMTRGDIRPEHSSGPASAILARMGRDARSAARLRLVRRRRAWRS